MVHRDNDDLGIIGEERLQGRGEPHDASCREMPVLAMLVLCSCQRARRPGLAARGRAQVVKGRLGAGVPAGNSILQQVGFAAAAGIALTAFVMAMFFSPSLTALVGNRAWWPGHQGDRR